MPDPLSVEERAELLFSAWDSVAESNIPDLLFALRSNGTSVSLFKDQIQQMFTAQVAHLTAQSIQLALQNVRPGDQSFQTGGKVLCIGYGKDYSMGFMADATAADGNTTHISYPKAVHLRKGRMHERFALKVPISAQWNKDAQEVVFGDVMDISLGGFLGGMNVATFNDGTRTFRRGEIGQVILTKPDGQQWLGSAELRHSNLITSDNRPLDDIIGPIKGFSLLGFAFIFDGSEKALSLEQFLDGTLEST